MSDPFIGEIKMFAGNFAPRSYADCEGQLLAVSQNDALFSLLGTIYGGDGRTTFGLPDFRGRVPVHAGNGPGLTDRRLGSKAGSEEVNLTVNQIPSHNHGGLHASSADATATTPQDHVFAKSLGGSAYHTGTGRGSSPGAMNPATLTASGGSQGHTNMAPSLCISFIIALFGVYPSRN